MTWIKSPVAIIVATQLLFTTGDLIARANMRHHSFCLSTFLSGWFLLYFLIRQVAMFGQLYVFSALQLGKTMALFGATSIVVVNALGILVLGGDPVGPGLYGHRPGRTRLRCVVDESVVLNHACFIIIRWEIASSLRLLECEGFARLRWRRRLSNEHATSA